MVIRVDYDAEDEDLSIEKASEICLQCGVCCVIKGHSCHAQYDGQFDPRNTYVYDCLGSGGPLENPNIWLCVSCHKCEEVCPYEVSPVRFIEAMKAQAFERGQAHPVILGEVENIVETGYAFPLTSSSERRRKMLGLEPLDVSVGDEVKEIARRTGLMEKMKRAAEGGE